MSVPLLEIHACTVHSRALSIAEFTALAAPTNKSSGLNCSPTLTLTTAVHTWFFIIYLFTGISTIFRPSPRCNIITYSYLYVYLFLHSCAIHILYLKAMLPLFTFYLCPPMWMHTLPTHILLSVCNISFEYFTSHLCESAGLNLIALM